MRMKLSAIVAGLFLIASGTSYAQDRPPIAGMKGPIPDSRVLVIFVDSLRPDIVETMVAQGKLPNIKKLFFDQGLRFVKLAVRAQKSRESGVGRHERRKFLDDATIGVAA